MNHAGRQRKTNESVHSEGTQPREPCQASRLGLCNRRVTLNEERTPHGKLLGQNIHRVAALLSNKHLALINTLTLTARTLSVSTM